MSSSSRLVSSASKTMHKRRRSRSDDKPAAKKQETSFKATTFSETSQATALTQAVHLSHLQDENHPPTPHPNRAAGAVSLWNEISQELSAVESNDCVTSVESQFLTVVTPEATRSNVTELQRMSWTSSCGSLESVRGSSSSVETMRQCVTTAVQISDAWSADQPREHQFEEQEVQSLRMDLCEQLSRSLMLADDVEMKDSQTRFCLEDKTCFADFIDDHTSIPDDGEDAFADEEVNSSDYIPVPYNVELDWEE